MTTTARDIVTAALREIAVAGAADTMSGEDAAFGLDKLNRLLDRWNADRRTVYATTVSLFQTLPNTSPHTLGPLGDWVVAQRPVSLDGATLIVSDGTRRRLSAHTHQWWMNLSDPLTVGTPTDLYYNPQWPLGQVYLYPVADGALDVELFLRVVLAQLELSTAFSLPPGYWDAIVLTLAEGLAGPFQVPMPQGLPALAAKARGTVFAANDGRALPLATADWGMPGTSRRGGGLTGDGTNTTTEYGFE